MLEIPTGIIKKISKNIQKTFHRDIWKLRLTYRGKNIGGFSPQHFLGKLGRSVGQWHNSEAWRGSTSLNSSGNKPRYISRTWTVRFMHLFTVAVLFVNKYWCKFKLSTSFIPCRKIKIIKYCNDKPLYFKRLVEFKF